MFAAVRDRAETARRPKPAAAPAVLLAAPDVPSLGDVSPQYAKLVAKRWELVGLVNARRDEAREILAFLEEAGRGRKAPGSDHQSQVDAVLQSSGPPRDAGELAAKRKRYAEAQDEQRFAERELEKIERLLQHEGTLASQKVCEIIRPRYAAAIEHICEAILEVRKAQLEYHELVDALEAQGIRWTALNPMPPSWMGGPRDNQGRAARYLNEAADNGYFDPARIPEVLWQRRGSPPAAAAIRTAPAAPPTKAKASATLKRVKLRVQMAGHDHAAGRPFMREAGSEYECSAEEADRLIERGAAEPVLGHRV